VSSLAAWDRPEGDGSQIPPIRLHGLVLEPRRRLATFRGRNADLTGREAELLAFLMRHPDSYFSAEELLRLAWRSETLSADELRIYVGRLRRKLAPLSPPFTLVGQQWLGYELRLAPSGLLGQLARTSRDLALIAYRRLDSLLRRRPGGRI
jgi:DNA-binding response OmpR family regulator